MERRTKERTRPNKETPNECGPRKKERKRREESKVTFQTFREKNNNILMVPRNKEFCNCNWMFVLEISSCFLLPMHAPILYGFSIGWSGKF